MKKIILIFLLSGFKMFTQSVNHSTIDNLEVSYKLPDHSTNDSIIARSQSVITLKTSVDVSVIHFKILNESNNTTVYQVNYLANSPVITNSEGIVLFKKEANLIYINSATEMPLNVYLYQVTTEDSQGIISEVYTDIK